MNHLNFATPEDALKGKKLYEEVVRDTEKRIRAEVLAACIQAVDTEQYSRRYDSSAVWDTFEDMKKALKELQPAAKDLKELLRQERESVHDEMSLIAAQAARVLAGNAPKNGEAKQFAAFVLEKARASEVNP